MRNRGGRAATLAILLALASGPPDAEGQAKPSGLPKKILVELYTSQGCNSCPPASDLLGRLAKLGYGPDRVVVLNFHVDYFNAPWVDPYSGPIAGRRQAYYNEALRRRDLSFTPLMVVDGRHPLVGSDRPKALSALSTASRGAAGMTLDLTLVGTGPRKSLSIKMASRSTAVDGRELLVGVALAEDPVTTRVGSGENAGRTLVEHQVVRRFVQRAATLDRPKPQNLTIPLELPVGGDAGRFRVAVFVQDRLDGSIYQAESIPWASPEHARELSPPTASRKSNRPKIRRSHALDFAGFAPMFPPGSSDIAPSCPDCGTPFSPEYLSMLPPGYNPSNRHLFPQIAPPMC